MNRITHPTDCAVISIGFQPPNLSTKNCPSFVCVLPYNNTMVSWFLFESESSCRWPDASLVLVPKIGQALSFPVGSRRSRSRSRSRSRVCGLQTLQSRFVLPDDPPHRRRSVNTIEARIDVGIQSIVVPGRKGPGAQGTAYLYNSALLVSGFRPVPDVVGGRCPPVVVPGLDRSGSYGSRGGLCGCPALSHGNRDSTRGLFFVRSIAHRTIGTIECTGFFLAPVIATGSGKIDTVVLVHDRCAVRSCKLCFVVLLPPDCCARCAFRIRIRIRIHGATTSDFVVVVVVVGVGKRRGRRQRKKPVDGSALRSGSKGGFFDQIRTPDSQQSHGKPGLAVGLSVFLLEVCGTDGSKEAARNGRKFFRILNVHPPLLALRPTQHVEGFQLDLDRDGVPQDRFACHVCCYHPRNVLQPDDQLGPVALGPKTPFPADSLLVFRRRRRLFVLCPGTAIATTTTTTVAADRGPQQKIGGRRLEQKPHQSPFLVQLGSGVDAADALQQFLGHAAYAGDFPDRQLPHKVQGGGRIYHQLSVGFVLVAGDLGDAVSPGHPGRAGQTTRRLLDVAAEPCDDGIDGPRAHQGRQGFEVLHGP
mmetsp:Transcript_7307/g.21186  ORF Transcript_7307/g.21186 Transcript_7307/m.21186 type:complete len:588 (+) Transcript_7307:429-2192(+)